MHTSVTLLFHIIFLLYNLSIFFSRVSLAFCCALGAYWESSYVTKSTVKMLTAAFLPVPCPVLGGAENAPIRLALPLSLGVNLVCFSWVGRDRPIFELRCRADEVDV